MLHYGHRVRGRLPSTRTTIVYKMWQFTKWTRTVVQLEALPVHPTTGQAMLCAAQGKDILYIRASTRVGGWGSLQSISFPPCCEPTDGSPRNLPLGPLFTQDIRCVGVVFTNGYSLHSLSVVRTPLYSVPMWHDRFETPYLPSSLCWYVSTPNQITLSGRGTPIAALPLSWKR